MRQAVKKIDSEYILFMLEDFFYEKPINVTAIEQCIDVLEKNPTVISVQLVPAAELMEEGYVAGEEVAQGIIKRDLKKPYTIIAGPTIWRKSELLKVTKMKDSPWEWEAFGSKRLVLYGKDVLTWKNWKTDPIFDYDIKHGGAVHRGKWVGYKVRELEKKYNYKLDYGKREVVEDWMKDEKPTLLPKWKRIRSILKNRLTPCMEVCYGLLLRYKPD